MYRELPAKVSSPHSPRKRPAAHCSAAAADAVLAALGDGGGERPALAGSASTKTGAVAETADAAEARFVDRQQAPSDGQARQRLDEGVFDAVKCQTAALRAQQQRLQSLLKRAIR